MILPDLNLLIYAYIDSSPQHRQAREWWEELLSGHEVVGLDWLVLVGFIRITTNRSAFVDPMTVAVAVGHVRSWLARPNVRILQPTSAHLDLMEDLATAAGGTGKIITDVHLAALAVENGAEICTNDGDFDRFPGLRHTNPLES